jgi:EmrB/QacA subfamily drug resistance transporter
MENGLNTKRSWSSLASLCVALLMIALNTTAISNILTSIANQLHVNLSSLQWVVNTYFLILAAFVVIGGQLGDLFGRRKMFLIGLVLFAMGSAITAMSQVVWMMIIGRVVQSLGAATIMPATLSVINVVFTAESKKTAYAIWGAVVGLGFALGPLFGGFINEALDWHWVFWLNIPLAAIAGLIALVAMPESQDDHANPAIDFGGVVTLGLGVFGLIFALDQGQSWGFGSTPVLLIFAASLVCFVIFVFVELKVKAPLVHLGHFRERTFVGANIGVFLLSWLLFSVTFQFNIVFQNHLTFGLSALQAGLALLPMSGCYFISSLFAGKAMEKLGGRGAIVVGMLCLAVGLFWLAMVAEPDVPYIQLCLPLIVLGIGMGLTTSPTSAVALGAVPLNNVGEASGITNVSRYIGGAIGVAVSGLIYSSSSTHDLLVLLKKANVDQVETRAVEGMIAGVKATSNLATEKISPDKLAQFMADAKMALFEGFSTSAMFMAALALVAALACFLLIRDRKN